jgi:hypothetical protein
MNISREAAEINKFRNKILKDIAVLLKRQSSFEDNVNKKFRIEFNRNKQSMDQLEDFYHLKYLSKKNLQSVKTAHNLLSRMDDLSRFEIEEEDILLDILKGKTKG